MDRVVDAYKRDIDRTLIRYNLTLTIEQRFEQLARLQAFAEALREAGPRAGVTDFAGLVKALAPLRPYLRGAPPGLPFSFDETTVQRGLNFTLVTTFGPLDLFGELTGGGTYDKLSARNASDAERGRYRSLRYLPTASCHDGISIPSARSF